MFSATLEPLINECQSAIELAQAGDHVGARARLDRIRYLRSLMARAQPNQVPDAGLLITSVENVELVALQKNIATAANKFLAIINEWISSSRAAFTMAELRLSEEGINLFIDDALPPVWDFNQDIVVLTDHDGAAVRDALRNRGQKRFVWLLHEKVHEDILGSQEADKAGSLSIAKLTEENAEDTLFIAAGQQADLETLKLFIGASLPRMALLVHKPSDPDQLRFSGLSQAVSSAVIRSATAQWLCEQTTEQYLSHIERLTKCASVMSLRDLFYGADVLILSPGPSLKRDFDLLKRHADRFVTIAPVKSLEALFSAGIIPDFAIWIDPRDHSYAIPQLKDLENVPLILGESCHDAFFDAPFKQHFIYPDPNFLTSPVTKVLHGSDPLLFSGASVSTLATVMSTALGAASVTLIGQDLSIAEGQYVSPSAVSAENPTECPGEGSLTCKAIGGGELPTQPNYLGFISEFQLMARVLSSEHQLINCTASGAYLDGWDHVPFSEHPLVKASENSVRTKRLKKQQPVIPAPPSADLLNALDLLDAQMVEATHIAQELINECLLLVERGENDVTRIEELEGVLRPLLHERCAMLTHYLTPRSMAMKAASEASATLEDNLRLSADYYDVIARAASKLSYLIKNAKESVEALVLI